MLNALLGTIRSGIFTVHCIDALSSEVFGFCSGMRFPGVRRVGDFAAQTVGQGAEVMLPSPFWERKILKRFSKMDYNQDGVVDQQDLDCHIAIVSKAFKQNPDGMQELRHLYARAWKRVWSFGVTHAARRVSQKEFVRGYTHVIKSELAREHLTQTIHELLGGCFDEFDRANNGGTLSGQMSQNEFVKYVMCWNLTEAEAQLLYSDIASSSGVSRQQYLEAAMDFYFCMDEASATASNFFGKLRERRQHLSF